MRSTTSNPAALRCASSAAPDAVLPGAVRHPVRHRDHLRQQRHARQSARTPATCVRGRTWADSERRVAVIDGGRAAVAATVDLAQPGTEAEEVHAVGVGGLGEEAGAAAVRAPRIAPAVGAGTRSGWAAARWSSTATRLGVGEGADGVDERAAGAQQRDGGVDERALDGRQALGRGGVDAPAGVGAAAQRAEARARRVDEHPVERSRGEGRAGRVGGQHRQAGRRWRGRGRPGRSRMSAATTVAPVAASSGGLAARGGAQVGDPLPRPGPDRLGHPLGGQVLDVAVGPLGDRRRRVHHLEGGHRGVAHRGRRPAARRSSRGS